MLHTKIGASHCIVAIVFNNPILMRAWLIVTLTSLPNIETPHSLGYGLSVQTVKNLPKKELSQTI